MKLRLNRITNSLPLKISLGILGAVAIIGIAFFLVQRYMSIFSYLGMNPNDVDRVKASFDSKCEPISSACRDGFFGHGGEGKYCRGIYLCGGIPWYWHYDRTSKRADYSVYPVINELWSSGRDWTGFTGKTTVW